MDFSLTPAQEKAQREARDFAKEHVATQLKQLEENPDARNSLFEKMGREGFFTWLISKKFGGAQCDTLSLLLGIKEISKTDCGIGVAMTITNAVAETIEQYGTNEQCLKYLKKIADGGSVPYSFALTEETAGSDISAIKTRASIDSSDPHWYVLKGEKKLIFNADTAGVIIVIARTDKGAGAFLVDRDTHGMAFKKENTMGLLTANVVSIKFENCRLHVDSLLGNDGNGMKVALNFVNNGRLGAAAQALGVAEAAFEASIAYSKMRKQFGKPIGDYQAISFKLADMKVKLDTGYLLLSKAAWLKDQGLPCLDEASQAKLFCTECGNWIATEALQIHGGYGYTKEYSVEKYFRDIRATTLYGGTSEIQRNNIARHLLK